MAVKRRECKTCIDCKSVEEWRPIAGYEGRYEVSSHGRVRSLARSTVNKLDREYHYPEKVLRTDDSVRGGYPRVVLHSSDRGQRRRVHRLVAEAFLEAPPDGKTLVRHLDHDVSHNCRSNLAWGDMSDNAQDSIRDGKPWGENGNLAKVTCPRGHPYDGVSSRGRNGKTFRFCRKCSRESKNRSAQRKRDEAKRL